ncbi:hypothetical protein [Yersinia similis]|uniref:hypothetical protein n=1 Tax=Yersinia similis TaxID=367190 RepID=UPI001E60A51C|nr:hypothetical protein [Yersinia similis]
MFDSFSVDYPGTGEVGDIRAIWFTCSFVAARKHSWFTKQDGLPRVYECELASETVILRADLPLNQQPGIAKRLITTLPICISVNANAHYDSLFCDYNMYLRAQGEDHLSCDAMITLFRNAGIDAIYDYERGWQDSSSSTTVVLSPEKIQIMNIHET